MIAYPRIATLASVALAVWILSGEVFAEASWRDSLGEFFSEHCLDCHQGTDAAAGLNLSSLDADLGDAEVMRRWIAVHDRVAAGEMPPEDAEPLDERKRQMAVGVLADALRAADRQVANVVLRRLNRAEYENTLRDLFGADLRIAQLLPADTATSGFDNVGEGLAVSPEAIQSYLRAADAALDAVFGSPRPTRRIHHETNLLDQKTHDGKPFLAKQLGKMFRETEDGLVIFQSGYCPTNLVNFARLNAPAGTYRGTVQVRAIQSDEPVTLRIYAGDTIVGRREKHVVGYYDIPPGDWTTVRFTDQLVEAGGTFQFKCYGTQDTRKDADTYPEPGIEIGDITIEGPLEPWPPRSRNQLLRGVDVASVSPDDARRVLADLLPRAFRRPVTSNEVQKYVAVTNAALDQGRSFEDSLRLGIKAILCSPHFLYLDEPVRHLDERASHADQRERDRISQHAIASRLSYFLWSSMPDDALRSLADQGLLDEPEVLRNQVNRMLDDPRARALTENFTGQWLNLRDIDFTSPDQELYPEFDELLRISMVEETHRFFRELIEHDLSVMNFIDSDFTFLNQRLAEHYGIDGVRGQQLRKVDLPEDSVRGGVLTHASVLKVTANGTNTSPVVRGVWVLQSFLGQDIPPPPSSVAAVEPDIRGATTLRQQLEKHRDVASCSVCHRRIDPAGFALENFDVIGGWRQRYRTLGDKGDRPGFKQDPHTYAWIRYRLGLPVDASGQTVDGDSFDNIRQFKKILRDQDEVFARGLTRKLLTYALGRRIGFSDRPEIERIVKATAEREYGLRTLIHEIVQSDLFQRP
jgi:hypothetical protein